MVPGYYTPQELVKGYAVGLSVRFILECLKDQVHPLPCFRLNRKRVLISRSDFDEWVRKYRADNRAVDDLVEEVCTGVINNKTRSAASRRVKQKVKTRK